MNSKYHFIIKVISFVVLFFFTWTFGGLFDIAYAVKTSQQSAGNSQQVKAQESKEQKPEEKFQKTLDEIENILIDPVTDTSTKKIKLKTKKADIESCDGDIRKQFSATEKKLKDEGLPPEILDRHYTFVKHYNDNLKELKDNLDAIDKAKTENETGKEIEKAKKFLEKVKPPKKHTPLDPNKLQHSIPELKEFPIIEKEKADADYHKPILVASAGSLDGLLAQAQTTTITRQSPPTEADLSQTIEVQLTPEITQKAAELGNNPVRIYEWVKNTIQYEPYFGSLKGAQQTFNELAGNDFDQASLLIALLRAANIPARYVYGTIEVPIERIMNWLGGIKTPYTAAQILATNGIPGTLITEGGTIKYARFEHVWVEAYVDMFPSMGSVNRQETYWTPIDPSMKEMKIADSINISKQQLFDETVYINTSDEMPPVLSYIYKLKDCYDTNYGYDFYKIFHIAINQRQEFGIFLGTLPYTVINEQRYSEIPDAKRHKIRFSISASGTSDPGAVYSVEKALPEIAGKKITLSYSAASPNDQAVINTYGGLLSTPAYLIHVKPEIKLNNINMLTGPELGLGNQISLTTEISSPNLVRDIRTADLTHGINYAIGIPLLNYSGSQQIGQVDTLRVLQGTLYDSINAMDSRAGELLYNIALEYFNQLNGLSKSVEGVMHIHNTKMPSIALVSADATYDYVFGIPISTPIMKGLGIDAIRVASSPVAIDGDMAQRRVFFKHRGLNSSYLEHKILENLLAIESISAVKALQIAAQNGIPIYTVTQNNIDSIFPLLTISANDKTDIQNAVNAGKEVMVSRDNITIQDWTGVGYIARDPNTGSGAYMISNSLGGGGTTKASNPAFDSKQKMAWFVSGNPIDYRIAGYISDQSYWERLVIDRVVEMFALPAWQKYGYVADTVLYANRETLLLATNHPYTWILHYSGHAGDGVLQPAKYEFVFDYDIKINKSRAQDSKIVFLNGCRTTASDAFAQVFGVMDHNHIVNGKDEARKEVLLGWPDDRNMAGDQYALQFWMMMGMGKTVQEAVDFIKSYYISLPWAHDEIKFYPTEEHNGGETTLIP